MAEQNEGPAPTDGSSAAPAHGGSDEDRAIQQEITSRLEEFCHERGYQLSPSRSYLIGDLVHMRRLWGDYYCPCQPDRTPETVCVCEAVKDGLVDVMEACFCQLIVRSA